MLAIDTIRTRDSQLSIGAKSRISIHLNKKREWRRVILVALPLLFSLSSMAVNLCEIRDNKITFVLKIVGGLFVVFGFIYTFVV